MNDREAELVNWHAVDGALARGLGTALDTPPSRLPARVLIWDDEPVAQASSASEFIGPPLPGLKLAAGIFGLRVTAYGVEALDWDWG